MKVAPLAACALLTLTVALVIHLRGGQDTVPTTAPLDEFPVALAQWTGQPIPLDDAVLKVLGKGYFLNRTYTQSPLSATSGTAPVPTSPPVSLFIGYFPTQRTGQSIHSPQNCLPGSGWVFVSNGSTRLRDAGGKTSEVGDYLVSDGTNEQEVLYWYQSHGRSIASDYRAKLYMIVDSIRYNRTDAALVRLTTAIQPGEDKAQAHRRIVALGEQVIRALPAYIAN